MVPHLTMEISLFEYELFIYVSLQHKGCILSQHMNMRKILIKICLQKIFISKLLVTFLETMLSRM